MKFSSLLEEGVLIKRYKRFLVDVQRQDGSEITIYCPNTGSMKNCSDEGVPIWFSDSLDKVKNNNRKYRYTWEITTTSLGFLAGINTHMANYLVKEAIENGVIRELASYEYIHGEVPYGNEKSRIDFLLTRVEDSPSESCYVEVKSVTLEKTKTIGMFPDAVTKRGCKHLRELIDVKRRGNRAVLLFCVQHTGMQTVIPADEIDPQYSKTLREAVAKGVEVLAYQASITAEEIKLVRKIEFKY